MNGRETPQDDTDQQCEHCGLWFDRRGIASHQRTCPLKNSDHSVIPIEDGSDPADSSPPTPPDGVGEGANPDAENARADGSGLGLEGPPERDVEDDQDVVDQDDQDVVDDEVECPVCGAGHEVDVDALDDGDEVVCTECDARLVWRVD